MIHQNQHAYIKGNGITVSLLQLSDQLYEAADKKKIGTTMPIDQSSSFDCISYQILIETLELYGFGEKTTKWVKSYISHISQFVEIGTKQSTIVAVERGVPQGSVFAVHKQITRSVKEKKLQESKSHGHQVPVCK